MINSLKKLSTTLYPTFIHFSTFADSNYYLDSIQYHKFLKTNEFSSFNTTIKGHKINFQLPKYRNTTVVIGGGVIGVSTALYLCQNTSDNVILLEKLPEIAKESSNANGGIYGVEYNNNWVSSQIKKHFWNSLIEKDYPFKFYLKALFEKYMLRWIINMFLAIKNEQKNLDKIDNLAQLSGKEFQELQKIIPKELYDATAKGLLSLYVNLDDFKKKEVFYERKKNKGFTIIELNQSELTEKEPLLVNSKEKFVKGVFFPVETNVETEKFTNAMLNRCKEKYKARFQLLNETEANGFLFNISKGNDKIFGISTNKGVIKMDRVVVSAGLQSIDILNKLNVRCLLAPVKGYTLSIPVENFPMGVQTIVSDENKRMSFAQIGQKIRIAAFAEFMGRDKSISEKRRKQIVKNLEEKIGSYPKENMEVWVGLRPLSPDDVPFIGRIKKFKNVYVNTGHGSKGTTFALGAARLLMEIMNRTNEESLNFKDYEFERFC